VEFTYGVRMKTADAVKVGELAADLGVLLSVHAPYYINLASYEEDKLAASRQRILDSCQRAHAMGAGKVVFHPGFYQKRTQQQTYEMVRRGIEALQEEIAARHWNVLLCPETTGKPSQFGSLEEIFNLMTDTGCGITIDFAHLYARQQGEMDWDGLLGQLPRVFHAHFSGIEYGEKGEKRHIPTDETFFEPLARALIARDPEMTIVNESPQPYEDAAMMKRVIQRLQSSGNP
jgi:deoxyribonuclease-4